MVHEYQHTRFPGVQGFLDGEPPIAETGPIHMVYADHESPIEAASPLHDSSWATSSFSYDDTLTTRSESVQTPSSQADEDIAVSNHKTHRKPISQTDKSSTVCHSSQQEIKKYKARDERDNQSKEFRCLELIVRSRGDMPDDARPLNPHNQRAGHVFSKADILVGARNAIVKGREKEKELMEENRRLEKDLERMKALFKCP